MRPPVTIATTQPCNLCGGSEATVLSHRGRGGTALRTVCCVACGLVRSDPRPHDTRVFYADDYRLAYKRTDRPRPKHVLRAGRIAVARHAKLARWLRPRMRVLDVGSGGGEFAYLLQTLGHDVEGIEPNRGYAGHAAHSYGIAVTRAFVDEVDLPSGAYDLITMWHVLEHTEDPAAILRALARALRAGGLLVLEVPNVEAVCQSPGSSFHDAHLYGFNAASLQRLAAAAGLEPVSCEVSGDGGNLTLMLRPATPAQAAAHAGASLAVPGNHDRVVAIVRAHTAVSHVLSPHPWRRAGRKLLRLGGERLATWGQPSDRARLDALYAQALGSGPAARASWPLVAFAFALALVVEWRLLDVALPARGWSEGEGMLLYVLLQMPVVAGIVALTRRPRTLPQYARLAGWSVPLLALPVVC